MSIPPLPASPAEPVVETLHGTDVPDPYRWLEAGDRPAVRDWTDRQNAFTRASLDRLPERAALRDRLDGLLDTPALGTPTPRKGRYFYSKREGKQNQPVLYVRDGRDGPDRELIDPNVLSADGTIALDWYYPSRDGRWLAYGTSAGGTEQSTLRVRDVATGQDLPDTIERTRACSLAWLPDASGFYYTRYPSAAEVPTGGENYNRHVYFHWLGTDPAADPSVFGPGRPETDWPNVQLSPDGRWLVVTESQGWVQSEVYFHDRHAPGSGFVPLVEGVEAVYELTVRDRAFYVRTNEGTPRYRLFRVDPLRPARADWAEVLPEGEEVLDAVTGIGETLVVLTVRRAMSRLKLFDPDGRPLREVELPTLGSIAGLGGEWDGTELFYGFQSFTVPQSVYRLDLTTEATELWQRVPAPIDLDAYESRQVEYRSRDGTSITMFLASKKGLPRDGRNPTLLYGYGGFNVSLTPSFSATRFAFLERGGLLAIANLRGGGEYGEAWHQAGMLANKQNTFDDFLAAAEWLIAEGYTTPERLAIQGGSNGGLLVGAALTQRPDLFRAVVCQVPLLDMLRYHQFQIAKLWVPEYGSAERADDFRWLYAYSPYHHVRFGTPYPAVLLTAAEGDTRVDPMHARKMAAALQRASTSGRPVLLRLEAKAGHGAGKPRGKVLDELADVYAFLCAELGV